MNWIKRYLFPAPPAWNDLEQALLDDLETNPGDWEVFKCTDPKQARTVNRKKGVAYAFSVSMDWVDGQLFSIGNGLFGDIGDAVSARFRAAFACELLRKLHAAHNARCAKRKEGAVTLLRRSLNLD